jgi:hypothetical protein
MQYTPPPRYAAPDVRMERSITADEPEERVFNVVTVVLGLIALVAVLGLIPLGLSVLQAYQQLTP